MSEKAKRFQAAMNQLDARFGHTTLTPLRALSPSLSVIPTGVIQLDSLVGIGGLPRGQVTSFAGTPTSGMTTLALKCLATAQAADETAIYVDLNEELDPHYAAKVGVDVEKVLLLRPTSPQQAAEMVRDLATQRPASLVVVDGVLPNGSLQRLTAALGGSATTLLILSTVPTAALQLHFQRKAWITRYQDIVGIQTEARVLKNKFAPLQLPVIIDVTLERI